MPSALQAADGLAAALGAMHLSTSSEREYAHLDSGDELWHALRDGREQKLAALGISRASRMMHRSMSQGQGLGEAGAGAGPGAGAGLCEFKW